jgi:hypothetical protein
MATVKATDNHDLCIIRTVTEKLTRRTVTFLYSVTTVVE